MVFHGRVKVLTILSLLKHLSQHLNLSILFMDVFPQSFFLMSQPRNHVVLLKVVDPSSLPLFVHLMQDISFLIDLAVSLPIQFSLQFVVLPIALVIGILFYRIQLDLVLFIHSFQLLSPLLDEVGQLGCSLLLLCFF